MRRKNRGKSCKLVFKRWCKEDFPLHDKLDRQIRVIYPDGSATDTEYVAAGRVATHIDKISNVTQFTYSGDGKRTQTIDALGHITALTYEADSNLFTEIDANGNTRTFEYDSLDQHTKTIFANMIQTVGVYDPLGRVIYKTDQLGKLT